MHLKAFVGSQSTTPPSISAKPKCRLSILHVETVGYLIIIIIIIIIIFFFFFFFIFFIETTPVLQAPRIWPPAKLQAMVMSFCKKRVKLATYFHQPQIFLG